MSEKRIQTADHSRSLLKVAPYITLAALVVLIVGLFRGYHNRTPGDPASQVLGSANIDVIRQSESAVAHLIDGSVATQGPAEVGANASDYPVTRELGSLSKDDTLELLAILLDPAIYEWEHKKSCIVTPGVKLSYSTSEHRVDILFCFECDILSVYRDNRYATSRNFDFGRRRLIQWLQRKFPDDSVIESLQP